MPPGSNELASAESFPINLLEVFTDHVHVNFFLVEGGVYRG